MKYLTKLKYIISVLMVLAATYWQYSNAENQIGTNENSPIKGRVIGVKDGDTFEILINGKAEIIRLAHIDCPEKKQAFGTAAKLFASRLCFGKNISFYWDGKRDRNQRIIAEILLSDGTNVNKEIVRNGFAWHYFAYSKDDSYAILEAKARLHKKGIWSDIAPVAPWDWRKMRSEKRLSNP